ncbi:MAG TPA: hypothetical protein VMV10_24905 [Pirellulales bacterium]|nr:hypothetical protein [Pirellulales bacterium]
MQARFVSAAAVMACAAALLCSEADAGGLLAKKRCENGSCGAHACGVCGKHGCRQHPVHCAHGGRADRIARRESAYTPWDGGYYDVMWGEPAALVVPPTAELQTHYNWGVAQTSVTPIWHQFQRAYPGPYVAGGRGFLPAPVWPHGTDQLGIYSVRGPW